MSIGKSKKLAQRHPFKQSDFEVAHHYFGITELPCKIKAPYRDEKLPSVNLYTPDGSSIFYRDFGNNEHGSLCDLFLRMWPHCLDHHDVEREVNSKVSFNPKNIQCLIKVKSLPKTMMQKSQIDISIRKWKKHDFDFWGQYGITKEWLEFGQIYPLEYIFITKGVNTEYFPCERYAYAYLEFKDGITTYKIYQPYSRYFKWISQHKQDVWDLWQQLPQKMDVLIITKSRKDALSIWANCGIPCTSLQGEGYIPKKHVVEQLKNRANKVFLLYDNDFDKEVNVGREFGAKIASKFNLKQIEIPDEYESKDASDLYKIHGAEIQREVIYELIK